MLYGTSSVSPQIPKTLNVPLANDQLKKGATVNTKLELSVGTIFPSVARLGWYGNKVLKPYVLFAATAEPVRVNVLT